MPMAKLQRLRDCFLKSVRDTDDTDFTKLRGKTVRKTFFSVLSVRSVYPARLMKYLFVASGVYKKDGNNDLRNTQVWLDLARDCSTCLSRGILI
jgi:hypothetical protein